MRERARLIHISESAGAEDGGALELQRRHVPAPGALRVQAGLAMAFGAARAGGTEGWRSSS
jgi:hypothetical protein